MDLDDLASRFDAYGPATAAPDHLRALTAPDPAGRRAALRYLWSAALHQGTPGTVTPGLVEHLVACLPELWSDVPTSTEILGFLEQAAAEGTLPHVVRADLEAALAVCPDVEQVLRDLTAADRDEEFYDSPELTGALLAQAALGCRAVASRVVDGLAALPVTPDARGDALRRARAAAEAARAL